jgi:hypothetical protein
VSRDGSTRFEIENPKRHRGGQLLIECEWKQGESAVMKKTAMDEGHSLRQQGSKPLLPFPVSQKGKPGRAGSPHAAKNGGSPRKRASPLARSPKRTRESFLLTGGGLSWKTASTLVNPGATQNG